MDFRQKYLDFKIPEEYLLSFLDFSKKNSLQTVVHFPFSKNFLNEGCAHFVNDKITLATEANLDSFSVFFDFEKENINETQIVFSNIADEGGFFFGNAVAGRFFVGYELNGEDFICFFDEIKVPKRAILIFKKCFNFYSLGYFDQSDDTLIFQSFALPKDFSNKFVCIGGDMNDNLSPVQNFKLYSAAIIKDSLPGFMEKDLCKTLIRSEGDYPKEVYRLSESLIASRNLKDL